MLSYIDSVRGKATITSTSSSSKSAYMTMLSSCQASVNADKAIVKTIISTVATPKAMLLSPIPMVTYRISS